MYNEFAKIYDRLQEIDYNAFVAYYKQIFDKFNIKPSLMLDLACGTGNVTIPLAECGYDMIGVDLSEEMLDIAAGKAREKNLDILFLNQDMTDFELYGTVDSVVCALDGVNYLTENGELAALFSLIKNYLNPGGIFIFDINSEHKLKNILADNTFVYDEDDIYCVWSSSYDENDKICCFNLDFFTEIRDGIYRRDEEYQEERAYSVDEIVSEAERAGLEVCGVFDNLSFNAATDSSERIFFVIRKK